MSDEGDFSDWIGKTDNPGEDMITPRLRNSFKATFGDHLAALDVALPGLHWCLSPAMVTRDALASDGHPIKGGFLPPISLPRRMWASSALDYYDALLPNDNVQKQSTITDISWKNGKSGALCFVSVAHDYSTNRGLAIHENQTIVYRDAPSQQASPPVPEICQTNFAHEWRVPIDTVMLFRYSALTFNAHRIHYDAPYARDTEFYQSLVIHGPLQATLMLNLATSMNNKPPRHFAFRGLSPACGAQILTIGATETTNGYDLSVVNEDGILSMTGTAQW